MEGLALVREAPVRFLSQRSLAQVVPGRAQDPVRTLLAGQLSEGTRRVYKTALVDFFTRSGLDLHEVTRDHVIAYRNSLMGTYSASTVALRLSVLRQLFEEAKLRGILHRNPAERVRSPRISQESTTEGLSEQEAAAMLATCDRSKLKGARDYALLKLMLFTGLRRSEVVGARWGDIHQERGHCVLWVKGKGGKRRKVKLQVPVKRALDDYLEKSGRVAFPGCPLFVATQHNRGEVPMHRNTVYRVVKARARKAGIEKRITPHSLRHTSITLALDGGASVRQAQYLAGHADPKTTMRYDRNRENLDDHASDYIRVREG